MLICKFGNISTPTCGGLGTWDNVEHNKVQIVWIGPIATYQLGILGILGMPKVGGMGRQHKDCKDVREQVLSLKALCSIIR